MWNILRVSHKKHDGIYVEAECECGNIKILRQSNINAGRTQRCRSCNSRKVFEGTWKFGRPTHGLSSTRAYKVWKNMIQRCTNPNIPRFNDYGGRGITVCERWRIFENFYEDMGDPPEGLQLDRIDNDGNYEKDNCRWVTRLENMRNRKRKSNERL